MNYADEYTFYRFLKNLTEAQRRKVLGLETGWESKGTPSGGARLHWFDNQGEGGRDVSEVSEADIQMVKKGVGNG